MLRISTKKKFYEYFKNGSNDDLELSRFIARNWDNYKEWINKYTEVEKRANKVAPRTAEGEEGGWR